MQKFPELYNNQVALLRAQFSTGHILDDNCDLALSEEQNVYMVFEEIDIAMEYANSLIESYKDLEKIIFGKQEKVLKYIVPAYSHFLLRLFKVLTIFLLEFNLSMCQNQKYSPGHDFELFKNTPVAELSIAVEAEDTSAISKLVLSDKIPVDYLDPKYGNTLLTLAIVNNKDLSVEKLLDLNANPNLKSSTNSTPFLTACYNILQLTKPETILKTLIKHGADVNYIQIDSSYNQFGKKKDYRTSALGILSIYGNLNAIKILIENDADPSSDGINDQSIVSSSLLSSNLDIVYYLLTIGKAPIPDYVIIRQSGNRNERKMTVTDILNENDYKDNPEKQKLKKELLQFLEGKGKM